MISCCLPVKPVSWLQTVLALLMFLAMAVAILTALGFEHIGGYMPCKLCLEERIPYYIGIPLMLIAAILSMKQSSSVIVRALFIVTALLMLYNFGLSVYHAGAEYKFWSGPTDCSAAVTAITTQASDLLANLNSKRPPACDTAAGYFLGLSFAGWNCVASLGFAILGFAGGFLHHTKNA
ncbi:disulfide bond formation protein B [uncultured Bartonella sp.]|uniref:disulfide bond formation protein B n=1 Tax=uncultured Bartonella sp. TaxID=104108 RepID=UPI002629127C|nr:disulfide bond formation protein B [uncultured Bartonella sp.]